MPTSLTRQHFQALADALFASKPHDPGQVGDRAHAEFISKCAQWVTDRDVVAHAMRRFNRAFNRDRFDRWTERGMSDAQFDAAEKERSARAASWTVQGNYGHGWEDLTSGTEHEMRAELATYNSNEPQHPHRVKRDRA